jgi:peptidoglycan hydrolase-like protein with peptidoglycan-binding domain
VTTYYSTTDSLAISVQSELIRRGYDPGALDGVVGPQTRNAIAQFQSDHRLPVTGNIDNRLLDELDLD